ncbi:hypothetical protein BCR32DRAFT_251132 [Anaeromyces robustus]|uniref:Uncharacterized protein n=1 Tax=Anaeromyces robustus TaxID=1754192 RepID=A0A1Y1VSY1_9FUNG|nr:hypothetical protein BCR32DRAFT_251132 [Anaeromyces robustus]|eukprot:ORX64389.1 hypothetical protein BCR32DRAFT_251132 [Anaeromyces robustus]
MKGFTKFLIPLAITCSYAIPLNKSVNNSLEYYPVEEECENALNKSILKGLDITNSECYYNTETSEISREDFCNNVYNSKKCRKFYTFRVSKVSECEETDNFSKKTLDFIIESSNMKMKDLCKKDEEGEFCPYTIGSSIRGNRSSHSEFSTIELDLLCKSEQCTNDLIEIGEKWGNLITEYRKFGYRYESADVVNSIINDYVDKNLIEVINDNCPSFRN